jgi:hypothetical protein
LTRPDRDRGLSFGERMFVKMLNGFSRMTEGYYFAFAEELVRQHGVKGMMKWGGATAAATKAILEYFGHEDGHLMAAFASFWNGCDYCAYGHVLAHNLHYFEHTGKLFPLDEEEVLPLMRTRDTDVMNELRRRFAAPEFARKLQLLERKNQLRLEEGPADQPDDKMLLRCIALYEWINECSIVAEAPAPPLGPIAKKRDLHQRYLEARKPERAARAAAKAAVTV